MISSSFNSTKGNDAVQLKFTQVRIQMERRALQSLKLLVMYNEGDGEKWTTTLASEYENKMITILIDSFG